MKSIYLDICNYDRNVLCNIYDNSSDVQGQAVNVFLNEERNGWKEITFTLPCKINTGTGIEDNYRINYLKADYKLRLTIADEDSLFTDWYLITELGIKHDKSSKTIDVSAGHVSQLLKYRALNLEFSDDEGNNTGTAEELLSTILHGTGWNVGSVSNFYEKDKDTIKIRSLEASIKTGAFKLIEKLCEKFDARPIYYGDNQTVDIVPLNPFSEDYDLGTIPEEVVNDKILEITYGINAKDIKRTYNAETIITKLFAYGSYGDMNGYCGLDTAKHYEHSFTLSQYSGPIVAEGDNITEFCFSDKYGTMYYFKPDKGKPLSKTDILIWSDFDFLSRSYVWNETKQYLLYAYKKQEQPNAVLLTTVVNPIENLYPFLLNVDYYRTTGLLSDEKYRSIARWQRTSTQYRLAAKNAQASLLEKELILSQTAESYTGFAVLSVAEHVETSDGKLQLIVKSEDGDEGVLYRTDYIEKRRKRFSWRVATELKENGDPVSSTASVVYIVHDTSPTTWEKAYIRKIYDPDGNVYEDAEHKPRDFDYALDDGYPAAVELWCDHVSQREGDKYYLFCTNSMNGRLGFLEQKEEALLQSLERSTTEITEKHPLIFSDTPPVVKIENGSVIYDIYTLQDYAWWYKPAKEGTALGTLYFMYSGYDDISWKQIYVANEEPAYSQGEYYLNSSTRKMYHAAGNKWVYMETTSEQQLTNRVSVVLYACRKRDSIYKGLYEQTLYQIPEGGLPTGNYAFDSGYDFVTAFSTDRPIEAGSYICYDMTHNVVYQTVELQNNLAALTINTAGDAVTIDEKGYDALTFPTENTMPSYSDMEYGIIDDSGTEKSNSGYKRTGYINAFGDVVYEYYLPPDAYAVIYNENKKFIRKIQLNDDGGEFIVNANGYYIRIYYSTNYTKNGLTKAQFDQRKAQSRVRVKNYQDKFFANNKMYTILRNTQGIGDIMSLPEQMRKFTVAADDAMTYLRLLQNAQAVVEEHDLELTNLMGDAMREGTWQESTYVEGDEEKLYDDAMDNLKVMSQPDIDYDISYLELFGSNKDMNALYGSDVEWPDVDISFAVHLIDEELDINQWAYIDKISKCVDQRQKTTMTINTKLSLIRQKDFQDVLTRIAEVVNETKAKQSIYRRAKNITSSGSIDAGKLAGELDVSKIGFITGSNSFSITNDGAIVMESGDKSSAMMINSVGIFSSRTRNVDGEWIWSSVYNQAGITADASQTAASTGAASSDGYRAAGRVRTTDSIIEVKPSIVAGNNVDYAEFEDDPDQDTYIATENVPARINVHPGGEINMLNSAIQFTKADIANPDGNSNITSEASNIIDATSIRLGKNGSEYKITFVSDNSSTEGHVSGALYVNDLYVLQDGSYVKITG